MKRSLLMILVVLVMTALLAGVASAQAAAPEPALRIVEMAPPASDTWFGIEPSLPNLSGSLSFCVGDPLYSFGYYLKDHTYVYLNYLAALAPESDVLNFKGSYLFDFGFYAAVDYYAYDGNNCFFLTPGYRYNLNDKGFITGSFDYRSMNGAGTIVGYEVAGQYFTEAMSLNGEIYLSETDGNKVEVAANFKARDDLIWGAGATLNDGKFACYGGLTWMKEAVILDVKAGTDDDGLYYNLSGAYTVSDAVSLGLAYAGKESDTPKLTCKGTYGMKLIDLGLIYEAATAEEPAMVYLTYGLKF